MTDYTLTDDVDVFLRFVGERGTIALDTETTGLRYDAKLVMIQVGDEHGNILIFDCRPHRRGILDKYQIGAETELGRRFHAARQGKTTLIHNSVYDLKILLGNLGIELIKPGDYQTTIRDTMLQERILRNDAEGYFAGLGDVVQRYCFARLNKDHDNRVAKSFAFQRGPFSETQLQYAAEDVKYLHRIDAMQRVGADLLGMMDIFDLENDLTSPLARMEMRGFHLDLEKWATINKNAAERRSESIAAIEMLYGEYRGNVQETMFDALADNRVYKFLRSNPQLKAYFKHLLGYELESVDKKSLQLLADNDVAMAELLLQHRLYDKFLSDFGEKLPTLVDENGYLHPTFDAIKRTGRMGCREPNLQNIPSRGPEGKQIRAAFTAPPGYKMITADYSQMELRILAALAKDPAFTAEFMKLDEYGRPLLDENGKPVGDPHRLMASYAFHKNIWEVQDHERTACKTVNFGYVYGIGPASLRAQLMSILRTEYPLSEVMALMDGFKRTFPASISWINEMKQICLQQGYTRTPMGRIRWLEMPEENHKDYDFILGSLGRKGANTPIQGCSADTMKVAIVRCYHELEPLGAWVVNSVHDELVVLTPESRAEEARDMVQSIMETSVIGIETDIPFIADAHIADYWKK